MGDAIAERERELRREIARHYRELADLQDELAQLGEPEPTAKRRHGSRKPFAPTLPPTDLNRKRAAQLLREKGIIT